MRRWLPERRTLILAGCVAGGLAVFVGVRKVRAMSRPVEQGGCAGCARRKKKLQEAGLWPAKGDE